MLQAMYMLYLYVIVLYHSIGQCKHFALYALSAGHEYVWKTFVITFKNRKIKVKARFLQFCNDRNCFADLHIMPLWTTYYSTIGASRVTRRLLYTNICTICIIIIQNIIIMVNVHKSHSGEGNLEQAPWSTAATGEEENKKNRNGSEVAPHASLQFTRAAAWILSN